MYRNLQITDGCSEVMVAFNSLPIGSMVFDSQCQLKDINTKALELMHIQRKDADAQRLLESMPEWHMYIEELLTGKDLQVQQAFLPTIDGDKCRVRFNAAMLHGNPKLFLFQFFE